MENKKVKKPASITSSVEILAIVLSVLVVVNIGLLFFLQTQVKTITLLKQQKTQLEQDLRIVNSSEQIYERYKDNIQLILDVFPTESQVLQLLQTLETIARNNSDESMVKFASLSPQPEGDSLFLLFNVNLKTDEARLGKFLDTVQSLPYMTRILSLSVNYSDSEKGKINVSIQLKLYVNNPFSTE